MPEDLIKLWEDYFARYDKYCARKRKDGKLYRERHRGDVDYERKRKEQARRYSHSPAGRQKKLESIYRFIENHPEYNLEFLERLIKINERTVSLDARRGESDVNLYHLIAG